MSAESQGIDRRGLFRILAAGAATAAVAVPPAQARVAPEEVREAPQNAASMLYDTTLCIGCKACVGACNEANGLLPDPGFSKAFGNIYDAPPSLNASTKNIIKLYKSRTSDEWSFVKQQCMHCVDPSCVQACPLSALTKGDHGIVAWNGNQCIGCRCCQLSCPFNIPKFEWSSFNPKIVKCEFCRHLLAVGKNPACTSACPRGAVIYGTREQLMAEAKNRIAKSPGKYFENRVYGEKEGGGTQVLYLSHVAFSQIGLPDMEDEANAARVRSHSAAIYHGGVTPLVIYGVLLGFTRHFFKKHLEEAEQERAETGLKEQL
uniref:4Fe-4S ferredoxin, iron-sulfur binding domain protein n=1 Tax=Solibacter usitatus (strain Ellin6076) TaxID=234267 RepID=Q01R83_SOLUE